MTDAQTFERIAYTRLGSEAHARAEAAARVSGYTAGYAEGARAAEAELAHRREALDAQYREQSAALDARLQQRISTLERVIVAVDARTTPVLAEAQDALALAAIELAEAVVGHELRDAADSARSITTRVLAQIDASDIVTRLRVPPGDAALVEAELRDIRAYVVVADASLGRGDVVAELAEGFIDLRVTAALARARGALLDGVGGLKGLHHREGGTP
ncbi:FliH/SctL family protein [Gryllotalpicola sp.]|uniref:FliH/SctL family protein n=1 Tax=Gryllotalpicola sp. TaxID=1932787 RepID=UPI00262DDBE3|nr:FliH/SctL family protein [Gryllotalpicola sp.]